MSSAFTSQHTNKLDAKGRVSIPATYRQVLAEQQTPDGFLCSKAGGPHVLRGFGKAELDKLGKTLDTLQPGSREYIIRATYAAQTTMLSFDDEGRVRIPDELIAHAGLKDRVFFNGLYGLFEMWDPEQFAAIEGNRIAELQKLLGLDGGAV